MQNRGTDEGPRPGDHDGPSDTPTSKRRKKEHDHGEGPLAREVGLMREGGNSATFLGSASGIHFIRSVYSAVGTPVAEQTSPETNLVPGEDDRLEGPQKQIWLPSEIAQHASQAVSFDDLTTWTDNYFKHWHPAFPLLHAPTVLVSLELVAHSGITQMPSWEATIVKAIMSLSAADQRQMDTPLRTKLPPKDLLFSTYDEALLATQSALTRPATLLGLQAVVCVQLFLVSMLRLNAASRLEGLIVQLLYQLGLHRCPKRYQSFSAQDRQLRKRLFWSIYCIERYVCQALGLPLSLRDEDIDVCHLHKELHPTLSTSVPKESEIFDGRLQLQVFFAQHAQLRGLIIELRNKRVEERDKRPDTAIRINAKLTEWWNEIEDFLSEECREPISKLHRTVLELLRHESTIMLNRPLLALPKETAAYANAIHNCIGAAKALLSALHTLMITDSPAPGVHQPMMWPSFTWAAWMSAFVLLYGAAEGKVSHHVASRNVDRGVQILGKLAARGSVWPQACSVAIEDLRSVLRRRQGGAKPTAPQGQALPVNGQQATSRPQHERSQSSAAVHRTTSSNNPPLPTQSQAYNQSFTGQDADLFATPYTPEATGVQFQHHDSTFGTGTEMAMSILPDGVPPIAFGGSDPFQGFDIPFWFGQDNYLAWAGDIT